MRTMRKQASTRVPARNKSAAVIARPVLGDHKQQVACASEITVGRYDKAFEKLAKV